MKREWPTMTELSKGRLTFDKGPYSSLDGITQINTRRIQQVMQLALIRGLDVTYEESIPKYWKFYTTGLQPEPVELNANLRKIWPRGYVKLNGYLITERVKASEPSLKAQKYAQLISLSLQGALRDVSRENNLESSSVRDFWEEILTLTSFWLLMMSLNQNIGNSPAYFESAGKIILLYNLATNFLYFASGKSEQRGEGIPYGLLQTVRPIRHWATIFSSATVLAKVKKE